ncbi:hypothetical protein [Arthrobacter yangruifuii]|uniref:hypothetical protein n=1 Tax=Arthrobacter yangruifuii TaxID=2606616 RepID=UPI0011B834BA|nr:hypothetical protein [Arthrobacter yangruifuii]
MTNGPESAPRRSRRAADVPVDSPAGPRERESLQRARDREALRAARALAEAREGRDPEPAFPTRRQLRQQQQRAAGGAGEATAAAGTDPNADVEGMSVEQALSARQALEGQARNQVASMEALQAADPYAVDLDLLAQQKALAERAQILNRRTEAIRKLAEENGHRPPVSAEPSAADNLAMVTPLEFVSVPGMEHPVMKAPPTSHIPIVTAATQQTPAPSGVPDTAEDAAPIGARSAFGLNPLDVMTAGLGRTRRLRFAVAGVAGLGVLALIVGILMIVGGLGG